MEDTEADVNTLAPGVCGGGGVNTDNASHRRAGEWRTLRLVPTNPKMGLSPFQANFCLKLQGGPQRFGLVSIFAQGEKYPCCCCCLVVLGLKDIWVKFWNKKQATPNSQCKN